MTTRGKAALAALAVLGILVAFGIGLAANAISGDSIGLSAQPLPAGDSLAPAEDDRGRGRDDTTTPRTTTPSRTTTTRTTTTPTRTTERGDDHGGRSRGGSGSGGSSGSSGGSGGGDDSGGGHGRGRGRGGGGDD